MEDALIWLAIAAALCIPLVVDSDARTRAWESLWRG